MNDQINDITGSLASLKPEIFLAFSFLLTLVIGLTRVDRQIFFYTTIIVFLVSIALTGNEITETSFLFSGMLKHDAFSSYIKILMNVGGIFTCFISAKRPKEHRSEYFSFLIAIVFGGHFLCMSTNFLVVFLSLEIISISSYVLTVFSFDKASSEGSLKYFLFGSVASAIMLYGFSILYGLTGSIDFASQEFVTRISEVQSPLVLLAGIMVLAGFLFKISSAPLHFWAPDVYEAAPVPVIAFLSVVPKVAALAALLKFLLAISAFGQSLYDWQMIIALIAIVTLTAGNFGALQQKNAKRMMAYSSIAQSGFLLVGIVAFLPQGVQFMLFYASVYLVMNFLVFTYLEMFERKGITTIAEFSGLGKSYLLPMIFMLVAMVSLTGLPPTGGFTAKLLVFSSLWQSYQLSGKVILIVLLVFGLVNTVISLFYYLRIPYFAFIKDGKAGEKHNILTIENLLGIFLVLVLLGLFFLPGMLMGWINKINFVL